MLKKMGDALKHFGHTFSELLRASVRRLCVTMDMVLSSNKKTVIIISFPESFFTAVR